MLIETYYIIICDVFCALCSFVNFENSNFFFVIDLIRSISFCVENIKDLKIERSRSFGSRGGCGYGGSGY